MLKVWGRVVWGYTLSSFGLRCGCAAVDLQDAVEMTGSSISDDLLQRLSDLAKSSPSLISNAPETLAESLEELAKDVRAMLSSSGRGGLDCQTEAGQATSSLQHPGADAAAPMQAEGSDSGTKHKKRRKGARSFLWSCRVSALIGQSSNGYSGQLHTAYQ